MCPTERRQLGRSSLVVSRVCFGTWGWDRHSARESIETALRVFNSEYNYIDTSNNYGGGESETRRGAAIAEFGGLPEGVVLQSKLDRDMTTGDFSAQRMRDSLRESLEWLGLERLPMLYLHDPEHTTFEYAMSSGGPVEALVEMKDRGLAAWIGISGGPVAMLTRYLDTGLFDAVMTHSRYTLLDRGAARLLDYARVLGVGTLDAAPFGGGLLAEYPRRSDEYNYGPAPRYLRDAAAGMGRIRHDAGIPIAAAALHWSLRDSRVDATVVGVRIPREVDAVAELAATAISSEVWLALEALVPAPERWLDPPTEGGAS
jgi:D-threo-aldose 1-dehydrogenase